MLPRSKILGSVRSFARRGAWRGGAARAACKVSHCSKVRPKRWRSGSVSSARARALSRTNSLTDLCAAKAAICKARFADAVSRRSTFSLRVSVFCIFASIPSATARRQLLPATTPPAPEPMRPDAPHDPAVELVEERSDVGALVILAPSPQRWIQFLDQFFGRYRGTTTRERPHPVREAPDRFSCRVSNQPFRVQPAPNSTRRKPALRSAPHNPVPQKIESLLHVNDPRLLNLRALAKLML